MSRNPNVTTPGGFFVGVGGIVSFCVVAAVVYQWVKAPAPTEELRAQQMALGLRAAPDLKEDEAKKKRAETAALLNEAKLRYNGGVKPNLDNLDDLRGVVRFREANKSNTEAGKALKNAFSWKDKAKGEVTMPIDIAMKAIASSLKDRTPKASTVKVDIFPPADPTAVPMMPNAMLGGARTVFFTEPSPAPVPPAVAPPAEAPKRSAPVPAPAPAAVPSTAPQPAKGYDPNSAAVSSAKPSVVIATPDDQTFLNWPESKK